jgi:hypothetical protein
MQVNKKRPAGKYFSVTLAKGQTKTCQQIKEYLSYFWVKKSSLEEEIPCNNPYDNIEFSSAHQDWFNRSIVEVYKVSASTKDNHDANQFEVLGDLRNARFDTVEEALEALEAFGKDPNLNYEILGESVS